MADAPENEMGYVVPDSLAGWWPDLDVIGSLPELAWPLSLPVFEAMLLDPQVASTVAATTYPIRSTGWWVDPNGADAEAVQHTAECFGLPVRGVTTLPPARSRDRFSFSEHLDLALDAVPFGHAVFEQKARIENGRAFLRKLAWRPQRSIEEFKVARDGGLVGVRQAGVKPLIPVDRLTVYSYRRRGGAWIGQPILKQSYKFYMLKERMLEVQHLSGDRTGVGTPIYTAPPTPDYIADDDERKAYDNAQRLAGLQIAKAYRSGRDSGASIPNGSTLQVQGVTGNLPDLDKVIRYYDEQMMKSTLANFLSLGGENSRGSYALGTTFADFFIQSLQATATWIADVLTQHVVEDIVDWNWGPTARAPRIVFDDIGSKQPATAEAITALVNAGAIQADAQLEYFLRATYGVEQRSTSWGKGDLDNMKTRVDAFKELIEAGASFETAKAATGLSGLAPNDNPATNTTQGA